MTFKVNVPMIIDNTALDATNVPENDHAEWSGATAYVVGNRVMITGITHKVYECIQAHTNKSPLDPINIGTFWVLVGPTNRWRAFDQSVGSLTTRSGDIAYRLLLNQRVNVLHMFGIQGGSVQCGVYDTSVSRRNLTIYSEELDNAGHVKTGATILVNAAGDPFGSQQCDAMLEDLSTGAHSLTMPDHTYTSGVTYTLSAYVRRGNLGNRNIRLQLPAAAFPGTPLANFDLGTGTIIGSPTDCTATIQGGFLRDFYRVSITATADATVLDSRGLFFMLSGSTGSYTGTGSTIRLFGLQLNTGALADYQWIRDGTTFGDLVYNQTIETSVLGAGAVTEAVFHDLPGQQGDYLAFAIYSDNTTASVGEIVPGIAYNLGCLVIPSGTETIDFSRVERDEFGNTTTIRRGYAVEGRYTVQLDNTEIRRIREFVAFLRAATCVWYDDEVPADHGLTVMGIIQDTQFPVGPGNLTQLSLEVLGRV